MRKSWYSLFFLLASLLFNPTFGQQPASSGDMRNSYQLKISTTSSPIVLDGELNEEAWTSADVATGFWQRRPQDGIQIPQNRQTEVRVTYDARNLYISAICYDTNYYVVQSLKRDTRFNDSDNFGVVLDPVNRRSTGFLFAVSPLNVQYEDVLSGGSGGGRGGPSLSWDNKWFSTVKTYDDRWVVEMAIPYKTLRFEGGKTEWGINFFRQDQKLNQDHIWTKVPVNFQNLDLGYTGLLQWESAPPKVGTNVSLIPYVLGSSTKDNITDEGESKFKGGFDAKVAVTTSLNLDLTVNPDFSSVAVDVQQTNLTRFNLRFPEQRPFFLENSDLFGGFGNPNETPFFSRAIGLNRQNQPVPILFGARLSGNAGNNLRVGALNMQTKETNDGTNATNFTALVFNRALWSRSFIRGYVHNRQGFNEDETIQKADYGRNAGLEFNYTDLPGKFSASSALHLSKRPDITSDNVYYVVYANYRGRNLNILTDYNDVGDNFYAELGLFQRMDNRNDVTGEVRHLGYRRWFFRPQYAIRPQGTIFNQHQINGQNQSIWYRDGQLNERTTSIQYQGSLRNTAQGTIQVSDNEVFLLFPTRFTSVPLPSGTYRFQQFSVNYQTDARKILALQFGYQVGGFYNGKLDQYNAQVTYRQQPWGNFTLGYTQNNINLPDEYGDAELHLINFRTEINFSTSVFWTTFYQFNTQANNFNINSRLQWRFKPMSDLFLVYTDNYTSDFPLSNKNRGIVLRLNYWLTL